MAQYGTPARFLNGHDAFVSNMWPTPFANPANAPFLTTPALASRDADLPNSIDQHRRFARLLDAEESSGLGDPGRSFVMARGQSAPAGPLSGGPDRPLCATSPEVDHPGRHVPLERRRTGGSSSGASHGMDLQRYDIPQPTIYGRAVMHGAEGVTLAPNSTFLPYPSSAATYGFGPVKKSATSASTQPAAQSDAAGAVRDAGGMATLDSLALLPNVADSATRAAAFDRHRTRRVRGAGTERGGMLPLSSPHARSLRTVKSSPHLSFAPSAATPAFDLASLTNESYQAQLRRAQVPDNSPIKAFGLGQDQQVPMPFSFDDLARHGLADTASRHPAGPHGLERHPSAGLAIGVINPSPTRSHPSPFLDTAAVNLNFLHGLPTPALGGSSLSSPSSIPDEHSLAPGSPMFARLEDLLPDFFDKPSAAHDRSLVGHPPSTGLPSPPLTAGLQALDPYAAVHHAPDSLGQRLAPYSGQAPAPGSPVHPRLAPRGSPGVLHEMQVAGGMPLPDPNTFSIPTESPRVLSRKRSRLVMSEEEEDDGGPEVESLINGMRKARVVSVGSRLKPGPKPKAVKVQHPPLPQRPLFALPAQMNQMVEVHPPAWDHHAAHAMADQQALQEAQGLPKDAIRALYDAIQESPLDDPSGRMVKRYRCLIPECGRIFPRKTAIESHIQTHLEDKPFVCRESDW